MKSPRWTGKLGKLIERTRQEIDRRLVVLAIAGGLLVLILPLLVTGLVSSRYERDERRGFKNRSETIIGLALEDIGMPPIDTEELKRKTRSLEQSPGFVYLVFYNKDGQELFSRFKAGRQAYQYKFAEVFDIERGEVHRVPCLEGTEAIEYVKPWKAGRESDKEGGWARLGFESAAVFKTGAGVRKIGYLLSAAGALFVFIVLLWLRYRLLLPVRTLHADLAGLDLREGVEKLDRGYEGDVGLLAGSIDRLVDESRRQLQSSVEVVENLEQTVELLSEAVDEIYSISSHQSSGATEQAASVYQASSTSKEIAASAGKIANTAENVSENARQTRQASDSGRDELSAAIVQVRDVTTKVEQVAGQIVELGEQSQKITRIIDLIREISEHTNLLALNAGIEAAGAGEEGKRFQVVAQEIRRLANRTLDSSQIVVELIEKIQTATNSTVMVTEETMKSAKQAEKIMEDMNKSFQNILEMVDHTRKASNEISLSTRQQTTACEQMVSTVMEVSEVASDVEKGAKETEESLTKISELSKTLKQLAGQVAGKEDV